MFDFVLMGVLVVIYRALFANPSEYRAHKFVDAIASILPFVDKVALAEYLRTELPETFVNDEYAYEMTIDAAHDFILRAVVLPSEENVERRVYVEQTIKKANEFLKETNDVIETAKRLAE